MTQKQAQRRYMKIFIPAMVAYVISCFVVPEIIDKGNINQMFVYALALIPALCMLVWFWGHWRYVREVDEYMRMIQIQAVMCGLAFIMSSSAAWGFLQLMADAPTISLFWVVPAFYFAYGFATIVILNMQA